MGGEPAAAGPRAPRVLAAGDEAVLLEFESAQEVEAAHRALCAAALRGVVELVPAARTILAAYDPALITPEAIAAAARRDAAPAPAESASASVRIPVRYDGPDLEELSTLTGLPAAELVRRHTGPEYVVAFCGFAPGFAYLTGLDPVLRLPRRATPRTRVPAGSVAVADEFTGVYPAQSPGGWHLLGRTDAVLWDVRRDPPALLAPGTRVRFEAVDGPQEAGR
jgi:KipI family sensor histidine kinase inhibitor